MSTSNKMMGIICTSISAIVFGLVPLFTCKAYEAGSNPITIVFMRSAMILPVLYILMKTKKESLKITKEQMYQIAIVALLGSGLTSILLCSSYQMIGGGTATTLHFLYPMVVALLCFYVYKEKLSKQKFLSLGLATFAMIFFIDLNNTSNILGLLMAAGSAVTYAFYMVYIEKKHLTHIHPYKLSFYIAGFIALEMLLYHLFIPTIQFSLPMEGYFYSFLTSICSSFLGVVLLQIGIHHIGSTTASIFCLFEPITSMLAGFFFLNEILTIWNMLGSMVILVAVFIFATADKKKNNKDKQIEVVDDKHNETKQA